MASQASPAPSAARAAHQASQRREDHAKLDRMRRDAEAERAERVERIRAVVDLEAREMAERRQSLSPGMGKRPTPLDRIVDPDADITPQSLIRRVRDELPEHWLEIRLFAAQWGEMPGEVLRKALDAGLQCLREGEE